MAQIDRSFAGEGIIYARAYQSNDPLLDIGNCDSFDISFSSDVSKLKNYRGGGGNRNIREVVSDVTAKIGMYDLTATNVARVTRSTVVAVAAGAIVNEVLACAGVEGELIPFKNLPDLTVAPVIKTAGDVALVAGTDYLLSPHGILVTAASGITAAGIKATYTKLAASALQLLNGSQVELEFYIAGLNDAQSGEPFSLRPRRAKLGLLSELKVFGQEYLKLDASAELLADPLVLSSDLSKFCEMKMVNKAA
jgi:hypothetical protein